MQESHREDSSGIKIIQWLLDTRPLWPVSTKLKSKDEVLELNKVAFRALNLLPETERASVLKYHHIKDAKMSLASHLLKHLLITKYLSVPWSKSFISRNINGKPCFLGGPQGSYIDFNVSHQAGIVTLIAAIGNQTGISVGTDVVCTSERAQADYSHIEQNGFYDWVDMYEDVFANSELYLIRKGSLCLEDIGISINGVTLTSLGKDMLGKCERRNEVVSLSIINHGRQTEIQVNSNMIIDAKLRQFYAMWCLREAYVKMTGEAFLAPWLKSLEILQVKAPKTREKAIDLEEGEVVRDFAVYLSKTKQQFKSRVTNVIMELTALGQNYMVAGAIEKSEYLEGLELTMGKWQNLDLLRDVIEPAELNL